MDAKKLTGQLSVSSQIAVEDIAQAAQAGFRAIIVNRPDAEAPDHPGFAAIAAAAQVVGLEARYIPVEIGQVTDDAVADFAKAMVDLPKPMLAYCKSGTRSATLWALSQAANMPAADILERVKSVGYDLSGLGSRLAASRKQDAAEPSIAHDIVIIGGGSGGIAVAASMLARVKSLDIAIIEPADSHCYQPGWTLVGCGVFKAEDTRRDMAGLIPQGVSRIKGAVAIFRPETNSVVLEDGRRIAYKKLVVAPGLKLDWASIQGLEATLGQNGVTSNYRYDLAPYTWELVQNMKTGKALFTQPPMPIKCAGAPQKALYLSCDHWLRHGHLKDISVEFLNAGGVIFGVADYVPPLMEYIRKYGVELSFAHALFRIDGPSKTAWFRRTGRDGVVDVVERKFDMIHVVPPQIAPDFIRASPIANVAGWVDVDQATLQHTKFPDIYSLGDVMSAPNAKTAAAARKQAPIVAENLLKDMGLIADKRRAVYDGYGSCPLTVERGKIVLAEFGYGGKRLPSFPKWFIDDLKPSRAAWLLKERILPPLYWQAMLKGREWLARPRHFA